MVATNEPQPGPEQPKQPDNHNLDTLQSMLNLIFIQSGRCIKEHQAGGGAGRMRMGMQRAVPVATERFHDALDELENQVRLAQTVLRRDLASIKEARKQEVAAVKQNQTERARLATEAKNSPVRSRELPIKMEKVSTPTESAVVAKNSPEPLVKVDEAEHISPLAKAEHAPPLAKTEHAPLAETEPMSLVKTEHIPPPPVKTDVNNSPRDPLFDATPTTANPQDTEFDFDAIFGDAMDTTGDNTQDTTDASGTMDFSLDDSSQGPSLLRGLEDFAKVSDEDDTANNSNNPAQDTAKDIDFDLPNAPSDLDQLPAPTNPESIPPSKASATISKTEEAKPAVPVPVPVPVPASASASAPPPPPPPTKPNPEDNKPTNAPTELINTIMTDDLEDLFNMDEYENPENSSFDDAFFNFNE